MSQDPAQSSYPPRANSLVGTSLVANGANIIPQEMETETINSKKSTVILRIPNSYWKILRELGLQRQIKHV